MKKLLPLTIIIFCLTSCLKNEVKDSNNKIPTEDKLSFVEDYGLVISEGSIEESPNNIFNDCDDNIKIKVSNVKGDSSFEIDDYNKKCQKANVLFDGSSDIYTRAADPFVNITFRDEYGEISPNNNKYISDSLVTILTESEKDYSINDDLATKQYAQMGKLAIDYKEPEIKKEIAPKDFEKELAMAINKTKEEGLAYARSYAKNEVTEKTLLLKEENSKLEYEKLQSKEKSIYAMQKLTERTEELINTKNELNALKNQNEITENNYKQKMEMLEKRVSDYAKLALLLKRENQRLAISGNQANKIISNELQNLENDSEDLRYKRMLKLAEDIKTDEVLARALHDTQKRTLQRKAQRLQTQADALAYHARADKVFNQQQEKDYKSLKNGKYPEFKGKIARIVGVDINKEPTLNDVILTLNERNRSLKDILDEILLDIQPMIGTWKLDVKLASHNLEIMSEPWNISAETTFNKFIKEIKKRTMQIHGVDLTITKMPENRTIVITDKF